MAEVRKFNYLCKAVRLFVGYEEDFTSKKKNLSRNFVVCQKRENKRLFMRKKQMENKMEQIKLNSLFIQEKTKENVNMILLNKGASWIKLGLMYERKPA